MTTNAVADHEVAVDMLRCLATVAPERRMDTLAFATKIFIEAGNKYSPLRDLWKRIERSVNG